jgi:hypothetical protein
MMFSLLKASLSIMIDMVDTSSVSREAVLTAG